MRKIFDTRWVLLAMLISIGGTVHAQDRLDREASFEIPAQPLSTALVQFSKQAALQVVTASVQLGEQETRGVAGKRTVREALEALLDRSGLEYSLVGENTVAIGMAGSHPQAQVNPGAPLRVAEESPTQAGSKSEDTKLEEVVVTAQKRKELLKDVPISISVLSGEQLDRSTLSGVNEELALVPGVITEKGTGEAGTQISMRGVAASAPVGQGGSTVAYYLDSVPFGFVRASVLPDADAYDLDRVEVLRGPQGTLYGASAFNGVVRIFTHEPDLGQFEVKTRTSVSGTKGGDESYRGDAVVNIPVVEGKFAIRGDVGYNKIGGFIDRPALNLEDYNESIDKTYRLKLKAQPTERLTMGLSAWISRQDIKAGDIGSPEDTYPGTGSNVRAEQYDVYNGNIDYDFGPISITSATSYIDYSSDASIDYKISPFNLPALGLNLYSKVLAEELNIKSTSKGVWRWVGGAFYRDAKDRSVQTWPGILIQPNAYTNTSDSFAVFGELTRSFLNDKFELTGGLRYFDDRVKQTEDDPVDGNFLRPLNRQSATFSKTTPRAVLTFKPNSDASLYLSYSQGFRSGFMQDPIIGVTAPSLPPVRPDTLTNYELGAKGTLLSRIGYEAALYYMDWAHVQENIVVDAQGNLCQAEPCFFAGINGVSASGLGFDLALKARITERLTFSPSFSWNDLTWDAGLAGIGQLGASQVFVRKGDRLPYSSKYTLGGSAEYRFPIMANLQGAFSAATRYSSPIGGTVYAGNVPQSKLTIDTGFSVDADSWSLLFFANNVSNERRNAAAFARPSQRNFNLRQRPRTVGLQFEYRLHR